MSDVEEIFKNVYKFNIKKHIDDRGFFSEIYKNNAHNVNVNGGLDANWLIKNGIPTITFGNGHYNPHSLDEYLNIKEYEEMLDFSLTMLSNSYILIDITDGALFYHADYVKPSWSRTKHRTTEIGDHIFYTWDK